MCGVPLSQGQAVGTAWGGMVPEGEEVAPVRVRLHADVGGAES